MHFKTLSRVLIVTAGVLLGALPALAAAQGTVEAVWAPRHVSFVYQGFTTHYSCEGLRDQIREMLTMLGARHLEVSAYGCSRTTGVEPFPGVRVSMQVLVPSSSQEGSKSAGPAVAARWHEVVLMPRGHGGLEEQGNCELIEQFKETFLPLFTTRHIRYRSTCIPHQLTLGTHLSAEVLMPEAKRARGH